MADKKNLNRRDFLRLSGVVAAGAVASACAPQEVVKEVTVEVEKEVTVEKEVEVPVEKEVVKEVEKEVVVTATPQPGGPWELIDWNKPVPMTDRLLADEYILPEGWDKATEGVEQLTFFNAGGLSGDIATATNMALFERKTDIKLNALEVGSAYTFPKFLSVVTSQDPSVDFGFLRAETEYAQVASAGWAHPVDELWPPDVQALYSPGLIEAMNWKDHFYATVNTVQWYVFYYRPSWLEAAGVEEVPETWEDIYAAAIKCREYAKANLGEDSYGLTFGVSKSGQIHIAFLSALTYSQGVGLLKDGKWNLETPEFRNAWNYLVGAIRDDIADVACLGYGWDEYQTAFGAGKAAMTLGYSVMAIQFDQEFPEITGDWVATPPPKYDASQPDSNRVGYINFDEFAINNYAEDKQKAAAMLYFDYMRSKEACMYELLVEGNDSLLPDVYEDPDIVEKVDWDFANTVAAEIGAKEVVKQGTTIPDVRAASAKTARMEALPPGATLAADILAEHMGIAVQEDMDPNEVLDEALAQISESQI